MLLNKLITKAKEHKDLLYFTILAILIILQPIHQIWSNYEFKKVGEYEINLDQVNHQFLCNRIQTLEKQAGVKDIQPCDYIIMDIEHDK